MERARQDVGARASRRFLDLATINSLFAVRAMFRGIRAGACLIRPRLRSLHEFYSVSHRRQERGRQFWIDTEQTPANAESAWNMATIRAILGGGRWRLRLPASIACEPVQQLIVPARQAYPRPGKAGPGKRQHPETSHLDAFNTREACSFDLEPAE